MNYNLRVSMERINGNVVTQLEVSSIGRARRRMITSPDFDAAMADLKLGHDALLEEIAAYNRPAPVEAPPEEAAVAPPVSEPNLVAWEDLPVQVAAAAIAPVKRKAGRPPKAKVAAPAHA
jgi:hypothetical protein